MGSRTESTRAACRVFGNAIREGRLSQGWTLDRFARKSGFSRRFLEQVEDGRRPDIRLNAMSHLAFVLGFEIHVVHMVPAEVAAQLAAIQEAP